MLTNQTPLSETEVDEVLSKVKSLKMQKGDSYKNEPAMAIALDDLLTQIKIKAHRACESNYHEKTEDEIIDVMVYSLIALGRLNRIKEETSHAQSG